LDNSRSGDVLTVPFAPAAGETSRGRCNTARGSRSNEKVPTFNEKIPMFFGFMLKEVYHIIAEKLLL